MRRQGYTVATAISAVTLTAVAAAFGAGGVSIVKHTDTGVEGPSSRAAHCPDKDHVLGGGFKTRRGDPNLVQVNRPSGGDSWATYTLTSGGEASAYALCERASKRKLDIAKKAVLIPTTTSGTTEQTVNAKCEKGWQVVSGGYEVRPPYSGSGSRGEIAVDTSMRASSRVWKVHGGSDGKATKLIAYAICEKKGESKIEQVAKSDTTGDVQSANAKCAAGSHVVGGGFQSEPDEGAGLFPNVSASFPASESSWKAEGLPLVAKRQGPLVRTLTSYAECEKG
jgi:hypothetical protein